MIIWFTGQPHSGKSTLAKALVDFYILHNKKCIHIDGDDLRAILRNKDYSKEGRKFNVDVAQSIASAAITNPTIDYVIVSMVSPYRNQREMYKKTHNVKEIYLTSTRMREGRMVSDYEPPIHNHLQINTDTDMQQCLNMVVEYINTPSE
jgi:adenylylsulfate kinase